MLRGGSVVAVTRLRGAVLLVLSVGCTQGGRIPIEDAFVRLDASSPDASMDAAVPPRPDSGPRDGGPPPDRGPLDPDAACSSETVSAAVERLPVDILWVVDSSASMQSAIEQVQAGLNDFAALVAARDLDYRVVMLSLRGRGLTTIRSRNRYQVCVPPPLSGDDECGDGPRFLQSSIDILSTQPLEQLLGTLGQTIGYREGEQRGGPPWAHFLRAEATKTIVVVTDDNARMVLRDASGAYVAATPTTGDPAVTADFFEAYPGGPSPFNSTVLPEGILHPRWDRLFEGYTFAGIYGWGSEDDPSVRCRYPDGTQPTSAGQTYTELVRRTGGVRAPICSGAAAWAPFFDAVARTVERASRIDCAIDIPPPPAGSFFDRDRINVLVDLGEGTVRVGKVPDAAACDDRGGWYYDDDASPTEVNLCPATCEALQAAPGESRRVDVQFGCVSAPV